MLYCIGNAQIVVWIIQQCYMNALYHLSMVALIAIKTDKKGTLSAPKSFRFIVKGVTHVCNPQTIMRVTNVCQW